MADPISSTSPNPEPNACIDESNDSSAVCSAPPQAQNSTSAVPSVPDEPGVCAAPSAVKSLVAVFSASTAPKPTPGSGLPAHTLVFLGATAGPSAAGGSYQRSATFLKAQIDSGPPNGTGMEVGSASAQFGTDLDLKATGVRQVMALSYAGYGLATSAEALAPRVNLGEHNDDGSLGGNLGAAVDLAGAELTISTPIGSVTGGMSLSVGASGSLGVRDADHDGKPEFCAKFSVPAFTLGACLEQFW